MTVMTEPIEKPDTNGKAEWELIRTLTRDMKRTARLLGQKQARALTDAYYQLQDFRIAAFAQVRQSDDDEPIAINEWLAENIKKLENNLKNALGEFSKEYAVGQWLLSICGIGPVISAGLLSHLDVRDCKTAGHFWRFAGLDPTLVWEKKTKRPYNARLKTLCAFKLGECFVKVQNNKNDVYGTLFKKHKLGLLERNERGDFAERAAKILTEKKWNKTTDAYKHYADGTLPPAHVHAMARRYAVKIFLSHLHHVMYRDYFGSDPPVPYVFEKCEGDHRHYIAPPNMDTWAMSDGKRLKELYDRQAKRDD